MKGKLDPYQRAAVDTERSSVVTAGAGSGKTTVLAERVVTLIEEGRGSVDSILTLTFTRKAAAEMYERIYRRIGERLGELRRAADDEGVEVPETGREKTERLEGALADFSSARISTIDSFCAQVVRGGSGRFGIPGDFVQDEHAVGELVEETAVGFLLDQQDSPALGAYIEEHGFSRVLNGLFIPLARNAFHLAEEVDFSALFRDQQEYLESELWAIVSRLEINRRAFLSLNGSGVWFERITSLLESLGDLNEALREGYERLSEILASVKLDKRGATSKKGDIPQAKGLAEEMIEDWNEAQAILDILRRPEYEGLYELLGEYQERILDRRRASGVLTFRDVVEMTVVLLQEDPELRRFYKRSFDHIMIDEFQDNNDLQRRLLYLLAEKSDIEERGAIPGADKLEAGKLFFVGDEKQSIYRFRGADVSVFTGLQSEIGYSGGTSLDLAYNYRSHPVLIDFFNRFFRELLADPQQREEYEAAFSPLTAFRTAGGVRPQIRLFFQAYEKERDEELLHRSDAEAWHVALRIRSLLVEGLTVREGETERSCRPGDIALLMRSTGNQLRYERFFRRLGIPYTVQSTRSLFMEAPVNDIYLILQLLVYPDDREAYAGLLRSPFVHLDDDTAFNILLDQKNTPEEFSAPFSHSGDEELFASEGEREKYRRGREIFLRLEELKSRARISELIRFLWYEAGYRYVLLRRPDYHIYLEFYDTLAALARRSEERGESLAIFLDYLRRNLGENEKIEEIELPPAGERGVQIMTIHKSKGLEFPIVFVVDMGNTGAGSGAESLYMKDEELGLTVHWRRSGPTRGHGSEPGKGYFASRYEKADTDRRRAELRRLLYVAATRAQDHLFLSGVHHSMNRNMEKQGADALLNMSLEALGWDGNSGEVDVSALEIDAEEIEDIRQEDVDRIAGRRGGDNLELMKSRYEAAGMLSFALPRTRFTAVELNRALFEARETDRAAGEEEERLPALDVDRYLQSEAEISAFGTLCHRYIESRLKGEELPSLPWPAARRKEEIEKIEAGARSLADGFLSSPLGEEARASAVESELSFALRMGEAGAASEIVNGQMDLCILREDAVLIVDFKTDRLLAPEHYAGQLALYREAAQELYGLPAVSYLFYLRDMRQVKVDAEVDITRLPLMAQGRETTI